MQLDNEYRLKLVENLEQNNHYTEYFDKFKASKLSVLNLYVYIELTTCPNNKNIKKEILELYDQYKKDLRVCLTIFLWKKMCVIVSFNGVHQSFGFKEIWFENIPQFEKELNKHIQYYYTHYIAKTMKIINSTKLTKERFEGWRGRAQAFKELRETKKIE